MYFLRFIGKTCVLIHAIVDSDVFGFFGAVEVTKHEKGDFSFKEKGSFLARQV